MTTYRDEFPDFPAADMPAIPMGFEDASWRNDTCPSFFHPVARVAIWIDYIDPAKREFPDSEGRFLLVRTDENGLTLETIGQPTDDWSALLATLETELRAIATGPNGEETGDLRDDGKDSATCIALLDIADAIEAQR